MTVTYNSECIELPVLNQKEVTEWIVRVAASYQRRVGDINFIFVNDERILEINREFIGHDYYTDHIGFDYCEGTILSGDIYISLDTVRTNAELFGTSYSTELHRVIIHGVLHLCGIEDKEPGQRAEMERAENRALADFSLLSEQHSAPTEGQCSRTISATDKSIPEGITHIALDTVDSTNNYLKTNASRLQDDVTLVTADFQTSGRGQRGNSWESEEGKNVVYSLLIHPSYLKPSKMFAISEVSALSICYALNDVVSQMSADTEPGCFSIKWPNDIYFGNRKVAGILIETDILGSRIVNAVIGVGVNVNQQTFKSDAPNPVSLFQILGEEVERDTVLNTIMRKFMRLYEELEQGDVDFIHYLFMQNLFRKEGVHRYRDSNGPFEASIHDVELTGHLILRDTSGTLRRYAFKEVEYML